MENWLDLFQIISHIANFVNNFPPHNPHCQLTWLVISLLFILIKEFPYLICCLLVYSCCRMQITEWIILVSVVDKFNIQNGAAHGTSRRTSGYDTSFILTDRGTIDQRFSVKPPTLVHTYWVFAIFLYTLWPLRCEQNVYAPEPGVSEERRL